MKQVSTGFAVLAACAIGLAGCDGDAPEPSDDAVDSAPIPVENTGWVTSGIGPDGQQIGWSDGTGGVVFAMSCLLDPARLRVVAPGMGEAGDTGELTLNAGDLPIALQALPDRAPEIVADVALSPELVATLGSATELGLSYGGETFGPVPAPEDNLMSGFSAGCATTLNIEAAEAQREDDTP
ncbi:MAG: hypothetical protein WA979_14800 [Pacificimonas sp.]